MVEFKIIGLSLVILFLLSGCAQITDGPVEIPEEPTELEIYYSFGVGKGNLLDTENNLYVKDMVCDPPIEYGFVLSESEKKAIYDSIKENDLFNVKDEFTENCDLTGICMNVSPMTSSTLRISVDGKTKEIIYIGNYIHRDDPDLKKFQNVTIIIQEIISNKEKEKGIEQPLCGYM